MVGSFAVAFYRRTLLAIEADEAEEADDADDADETDETDDDRPRRSLADRLVGLGPEIGPVLSARKGGGRVC